MLDRHTRALVFDPRDNVHIHAIPTGRRVGFEDGTQLREVPSAKVACQRCVAALVCVS